MRNVSRWRNDVKIMAIESSGSKISPISVTSEQKVALVVSGGIVAGAGLIGWALAKWKGVAIGGALGIASLFVIPAPSRW